ncbi:Fic family protein [Polaromonas naphthalenivorans]|uniref:Filamentation induced by cAMP protein Fic n=1 Tax=Polaromonas naphthalenivorans (strain CJ2) TaxID=365044 RepID=A1VWH4_POLNA|nr:Fic family protein [Polaromonas naphthalenivorans]ABM40002.1 filamentation induced by cAMP protein Fic [Polaromonas naphthalenivorans CJ2]
MPYNDRLTPDTLLQALTSLAAQRHELVVSSTQLVEATGSSLPAVKRMLARLVAEKRVETTGKARATRYRLLVAGAQRAVVEKATAQAPVAKSPGRVGPAWHAASLELRQRLSLPLGARTPVTYRREFVDEYKPNETFLLPQELAEELSRLGRLPEQMPAGTYVRKVLEQLLIDLSWSSSHLEGNRYTLLDTEELFKSGAAATDSDAVMLLNHKAAIEFLVDAVPTQGLTPGLIRNLHAVLMQDLLMDVAALGAIREKVVNISGTVYIPAQVPAVLTEMFERIISTTQYIKNPVEAAFFLWVNLAYLQPFEDGNKRVSRLAANIPLMLYNQAPLSFLDVNREDYALAMMGIYEFCDLSMAVDLFAWTYRRSHAKYKVVLESLGSPDPFRIKYREALNEAVGQVVRRRELIEVALAGLGLPKEDASKFQQLLVHELNALAVFNCARYRLGLKETQAWIDEGRPR